MVMAFALIPYLLPASLSPPAVNKWPVVDGELTDVVSHFYALDGFRHYRTASAHVRHIYKDDVLVLEPLTMQYYADGVQTMLLKSESGTVLEKGTVVKLNGEVELHRPTDSSGVNEVVLTRNLEIETERWIAITEDEVIIKREGQITSGHGMIADLKRGEVNLLKDVKSQYAL